MSDVEVSATITAEATRVYDLVSDVPRMGEWSPETTSCTWLNGANGPEVGARFRGTNRSGFRRWTTTCEVIAAEPGKRFAFEVTYGPVSISAWDYSFDESGGVTTVTERWTDRRPGWMRLLAGPLMGIADRPEHNRAGMQSTLAALKAAAES